MAEIEVLHAEIDKIIAETGKGSEAVIPILHEILSEVRQFPIMFDNLVENSFAQQDFSLIINK